jgi:hypothetical protein
VRWTTDFQLNCDRLRLAKLKAVCDPFNVCSLGVWAGFANGCHGCLPNRRAKLSTDRNHLRCALEKKGRTSRLGTSMRALGAPRAANRLPSKPVRMFGGGSANSASAMGGPGLEQRFPPATCSPTSTSTRGDTMHSATGCPSGRCLSSCSYAPLGRRSDARRRASCETTTFAARTTRPTYPNAEVWAAMLVRTSPRPTTLRTRSRQRDGLSRVTIGPPCAAPRDSPHS